VYAKALCFRSFLRVTSMIISVQCNHRGNCIAFECAQSYEKVTRYAKKASRHTLIGERSDGRKNNQILSKIISLYTMIDFQTDANIQKASELFAVRLLFQ
jgi:hypothetical protein